MFMSKQKVTTYGLSFLASNLEQRYSVYGNARIDLLRHLAKTGKSHELRGKTMKNLKLFNLIIWGLAGITNLMSDEVSKLSYGLLWGVLMMYLIEKYISD